MQQVVLVLVVFLCGPLFSTKGFGAKGIPRSGLNAGLMDLSGEQVFNEVANMSYIGGAIHECQEIHRSCYKQCKSSYSWYSPSYAGCRAGCSADNMRCSIKARKDKRGHFDCDDYAMEFIRLVAKPHGIPAWFVTCDYPDKDFGHALNVVEQPPRFDLIDEHCYYCLFEPQGGSQYEFDDGMRGCWTATCQKEPKIPERIYKAEGYSSCQASKPPKARLDLEGSYRSYPDMAQRFKRETGF